MRVAKIEKLAPQPIIVHDISVRKNHNFFIRPKGSKESVLVSNCHMLTPQAANAALKGLEEPTPNTLFILATTNPEKLIGTIVGRCTKLHLKPIEPEAMSKRLRVISKREGVNLKDLDNGADIVKTIVNLSNGRMRDAISLLDSILFSLKSSKKVDANAVLKNFLATGDADLEKLAASILVALLAGDLKSIIKISRSCGNCRGVLQKLRWLIQYLLDNAVGMAKYTPYSAKLFAVKAKDAEVKVPLAKLVIIQQLLIDIEAKLNSMSIDESVLFLTMVSNCALQLKS
jgi:DNA polymerase III gamma/tau subunit